MKDGGGGSNVTGLMHNESKPVWRSMLVGFLLIDGVFGGLAFVLRMAQGGDLFRKLLFHFSPVSFVGAFASGDPMIWLLVISGLLNWTTPLAEVICAVAIMRMPEKTRRLVTIAGGMVALNAAFELLLRSMFGFHFPSAFKSCAVIGLAAFGVWFVRAQPELRRPEVSLLSIFLLVIGVGALVPAAYETVARGTWVWGYAFHGGGGWSMLIRYKAIGAGVSGLMVVGCGLLLRRWNAPLRLVSVVLVLASVLELAEWVFKQVHWSKWNREAFLFLLPKACPYLQSLVLALVIVVFLRRHGHLFFLPDDRFCRHCEYDLTGNESGVCPECGEAVARGGE